MYPCNHIKCPLLSVNLILLTRGRYTIVDNEDYVRVNQRNWAVAHRGYKWYAIGFKGLGKYDYLHRIIIDCPKGKEVDHINGNALDNRRCNLRICTHSENSHNQPPRHNNSSGLKGVWWDVQRQKWLVQIRNEGQVISVGRFSDKKEAAIAYNKKAIELHGEFAYCNNAAGGAAPQHEIPPPLVVSPAVLLDDDDARAEKEFAEL